jgi:hypothetical protein
MTTRAPIRHETKSEISRPYRFGKSLFSASAPFRAGPQRAETRNLP